MELLIARNPNPDSSLPYLIRVPLDGGLVLATKGTWPRTGALYCHPAAGDWPEEPEIVERLALRACARRGAAIDVICDRDREQRSQIVFTRARGRDVIFWQSPRTRKQSRPQVRLPTARAQALPDLEIIVDAHERYPFRFAHQQAQTVRRGLACGDYAVSVDGMIHCAVERKSIVDLVSSLTSGRLRYQLAELAALPRAAIVVEEGYGRLFGLEHVRGAMIADGLAELQIRWPAVPIVFCESRKLAEEWTYRFLAAGRQWAEQEPAVRARIGAANASGTAPPPTPAPLAPGPSATELRAWARAQGLPVSDRGRIGAEVRRVWEAAQVAGAEPASGPELAPDLERPA
ncbi:ERCC4 domain-containing protein [Conexibacter sp. DBS9H8]|uniref:ERCC4 domain-containing protein n=1 Tax=Conexibacter sp. DBS9H8 TaxID=2937801 RepID=UPI00200D4B78|nr:ERCC4 domain-containing protein [Conexibacter sp. DBS9H8]